MKYLLTIKIRLKFKIVFEYFYLSIKSNLYKK